MGACPWRGAARPADSGATAREEASAVMTGSSDRDRALYGHADLARLIDPRAVAIIGVSANQGGFGSRTLANLAGFGGRVYAINPKYEALHGVTCYPGLAALPEVPDCVVIAL